MILRVEYMVTQRCDYVVLAKRRMDIEDERMIGGAVDFREPSSYVFLRLHTYNRTSQPANSLFPFSLKLWFALQRVS